MRRFEDFVFVLERCGREEPEKLGEIAACVQREQPGNPSGDTQWLSQTPAII